MGPMEDRTALAVVEHWSGGAGVVPRGPKSLLSVVPAVAGDIERHTGRRPYAVDHPGQLWRLEVGGRFLASAGLVYPGGVPFPEELRNQTAVIANEVWLYAEEDGTVVGAYWWPNAVRRPVASMPRDEYPPDMVVHPSDAAQRVDVPVPMPHNLRWEAAVAVCLSRREVIVFCVRDATPDPLNEMLVYEQGGISVRATAEAKRPDINGFLRSNQPPYRRVRARLCPGIGRDPGRALGPQTWPWPGELRWWHDGVSYEVKGFIPVATLVEVAEALVM